MEERTVRAWTRAETERREGDPHPRFPGVTLKERADGAVRVLTVRVEPDREIGTHRHEREWEIHQVLEGRGCLETEEGTFPYEPGAGTRIPPPGVPSGGGGPRGASPPGGLRTPGRVGLKLRDEDRGDLPEGLSRLGP